MYTEAYAEAEIWQESQQGGKHSGGPETSFTCQQGFPLADPPAVKELVRAEVKMLLQTLKERTCRRGRDVEEPLFRYKLETVNYALGHQDICYSNCSNPEDTENPSRRSSHCSVQSSAEDEIEEIRDKLNVNEIHTVVSRLRSIFLGEYEALTAVIKDLKDNIKQKYHSESEKSEPSLSELQELRGAIQMELELLPSSSPPPVKGLKNNFRLSAGQRPDTLLPLTPTSVLRPLPLCQLKPRPPSGRPPDKTSLSKIHGPHRLTSAFSKSAKSSGHANSPLIPDQKLVKSKYRCSVSPERDDAAVHSRTCLDFHKKAERNSPCLETRLSTQCCVHRPRTDSDLSPRKERKKGLACNSRNIQSTAVQADKCGKTHSSESSAMCESLTQDVRGKNSNYPNKNGHLRKDANKQYSLTSHNLTDYASHLPEGMDALTQDTCPLPQSAES
ncbi:coiled-coil domain-containing protein 24 [Odontesthes bonariensis]|uniref:coiled-coil domain-containing protein 24 n=1 Tax=Odontesthes bonariensis TaxID=219752 RepID=UPI003F58B657